MKVHYYFCLVIFISCSIQNNLKTVNYKGFNNSEKRNYTYNISIPKKYEVEIISGGGEWIETSYKYLDNSILYISNQKGKPSILYRNNINNELVNSKFTKAFFLNDTTTLEGIDKFGKCWKNKYNGEINIGYINVSKNDKEKFDIFLKSLRKK